MAASKDRQWTHEEDSLLRSLVEQKTSTKNMPSHFPKRTLRGIETRVYTLGLKSGTPRTIHSKDELFWDTPNPINCYYAGMVAADGSLNSEKHTFAWTAATADEEHLIKFAATVKYTGKISHVSKKSPSSDTICYHSALRISAAKRWLEDLKRNFDLFQNKTYRLRPPPLGNDYLMSCYLVGLLDGDGSLSFSRELKTVHIAYGSASKDIVQWVREFVDQRFQFAVKKKPPAIVKTLLNGRYYHTSIYGLKAVKFIELMKTLPVPRYSRKWENPELLAIIDRYHQKWPQYFIPDQEMTFDPSGDIVFAHTLVGRAGADLPPSQQSSQIFTPPV